MADLYEITEQPEGYPVKLDQVKSYMKITSSADDCLIDSLIAAATEAIEEYTGQYFIERTIQADFDSLFCTNFERYPFLTLRRGPLKTVTSAQVLINSTYTDEDYQIKKKNHGYSRILFNDFNSTLDDVPFPLRIVFVAGYGTVADVPQNIRFAIMGYVNFMYKNRNDCIDPSVCSQVINMSGFPALVKSTISRLRIIEVFA